MIKTICRRLTVSALLMTFVAAPALAKEEQIYTVKKGDTLWGLSQRFIDDPHYWPNMWSHNPDIGNPHLIFPGQKIRVIDGRLEIIPAYPEGQPGPSGEADTMTEEPLPEPDQLVTIKSTGSGDGFIRTDEKSLGTLVDSVDNRVLLTRGDLVFLKMKEVDKVTVGDTYGLFQEGEWIRHPKHKQPVGTMMHNLGYLQITEINGETVTARIGEVFREVFRGAQLYEYVPLRRELTLQRAAEPRRGYLVASRDEKLGLSTDDVIFIDLGREHGLDSGNLFYISRPRKLSTEMILKEGNVKLPEEVLGAAVVIEANKTTSSAIVIKSVDAIHIGDQVTMVAK